MSDSNTQSIKPTRETYDPLQQAYENLNRSLFEGELAELPYHAATKQEELRVFLR